VAAIGNAQKLQIITIFPTWPSPRLYDQPHTFRHDLPGFFVGEASMRERTLRPPRVDEPKTSILVGHVGRCRFDEFAAQACFDSAFFALSFEQVMDGPHVI
jgi:hypothetical protein